MAGYMLVLVVISLVSVLAATEMFRTSLAEAEPARPTMPGLVPTATSEPILLNR